MTTDTEMELSEWMERLPETHLANRELAVLRHDAKLGQELEAAICMLTHFTGEPPYVGTEGLVLAVKEQHARGLELAKALSVCIEAIAPSDRSGISMHEWNQRLKAAQKQACAALSQFEPPNREVIQGEVGREFGSVCKTGQADG